MKPLNETEIRLSCGIAKKVGRPNYSSYEASLQIEIVTNLESMTDNRFPDLVGEIYTKIQQAVDARIAFECRADQGPSLVPQFQPQTLHPHAAMATTQATQPAPIPPSPQSPGGFTYKDFLAQTCNELSLSPNSLTNYFYRIFLAVNANPVIDDANWQAQAQAVSQYWFSIPNAQSTFAQALNNMPSF